MAFVAVAAASVYAKQLAAMLFPVYGIYALRVLGLQRAMRSNIWFAALALAILALPVVPLTLSMSTLNVELVKNRATHVAATPDSYVRPVASALRGQLSMGVLALSVIGLARVLISQNGRR